ncbi:hypothetical protein C5B42_02855 [Candidatus Cerribacteria bacterium 'Amazon FNV 2010 28 9']|uniref:Uncharacterized protein n=1 Tax=Candidatus Cerribacteria bacterium 'Amazon FNV 2010 28 9' TaxID=2081795 RepID=A0A317JPX6_9BACT|nr:MAG: hypothetical protein C5B42_02855 [Candidatus Cerribacteria bacterium 'Amazon FNV 2010 28 9']
MAVRVEWKRSGSERESSWFQTGMRGEKIQTVLEDKQGSCIVLQNKIVLFRVLTPSRREGEPDLKGYLEITGTNSGGVIEVLAVGAQAPKRFVALENGMHKRIHLDGLTFDLTALNLSGRRGEDKQE